MSLEKKRRKFSRTVMRAHGMLLLTNQFHDLFECLSLIWHKKLFCAQQEARIYGVVFGIFLSEEVSPQTRLLAVHVWFMRKSSSREEFSANMEARKPTKFSNWKNFRINSYIYYYYYLLLFQRIFSYNSGCKRKL